MSETETPRRLPFLVWVLAAAVAAAVHLGCVALALEYMNPEEEEDTLGAPGIEIGLELTAPRLEPTNLPAGPTSDNSVAAPEVVEQKAVVKPTDLPKAMPTETDDPERVVATADPKKPKEEDPEVAAVALAPSEASVAAEAMAVPSSDTIVESTNSVTPAQGTGESAQRVRATWQKELAAHLDKNKRYPADRSQQRAEILVRFALDRTGHILSTSVVRGSGDASFDEAALAMMRRADPVPPPPPVVADEGLSFTMPVIFRVKGRN